MLRLIIAACFLWPTAHVVPIGSPAITNGAYSLYGKEVVVLLNTQGEAAVRHVYGYQSSSGHLNVVPNGVHSAHYTYRPSSDLISGVLFRSNGTPRLTITKDWDHGYCLKSIWLLRL